MAETRKTSPIPTEILRDTREQRPWEFDSLSVETRDVTLSTGDYALPAHCRHDSDTDTYLPTFAVERKSGPDFLTTLTWERPRFKQEMRRAAQWTQPLDVVVETPWQTLLRNRGCMARRDIHPNQIAGTVTSWTNHYNVVFHFTETRRRAKLCAFLLLVRHSLVHWRDNRSLDTE
jgi:ERCC4-type nuclease